MTVLRGGATRRTPHFRLERPRRLLRALVISALALYPGFLCAADLQRWKGGPTPRLELTALDGRPYRLENSRGKVVLVNFWATWCGPCREEMPSIERLKEKLAGRPFEALAVNLDEPEARVRAFMSRTGLNLVVLLDPGRKAAKAWNARILPASFIVGPDGQIRYNAIGDLDWADEKIVHRISELFASNR